MTTNHPWDEAELDAALRSLAVHDTTVQRRARIRSRALAAMATKGRARRRSADGAWRRLEPLAALAAGVAYMSVVLRIAVALYG